VSPAFVAGAVREFEAEARCARAPDGSTATAERQANIRDRIGILPVSIYHTGAGPFDPLQTLQNSYPGGLFPQLHPQMRVTILDWTFVSLSRSIHLDVLQRRVL
jgi:hypothetical protein